MLRRVGGLFLISSSPTTPVSCRRGSSIRGSRKKGIEKSHLKKSVRPPKLRIDCYYLIRKFITITNLKECTQS